MNIDWSKAPEDATHAGNSPYEKGVITWFKGISDPASRNYFMNEGSMNAWAISSENLSAWHLIERPKKQEAWDGEGLPPEKCDCEVLWSSDTGEYVTATVLAHDQGGAIVRYTSGKNKGCISEQIVGCFNFKGCQIPNFRPIKTAEQLAEEEREKAIADMMEVTSDGISCIGQDDALALYKAGYRKQ